MKSEKIFSPKSGYLFLLIVFVIAAIILYDFLVWGTYWTGGILAFVLLLMLPGFIVVQPNASALLTLFGDYHGTVVDNGFFWANPFYSKKSISLRARNIETEQIKVNDKIGNPIIIGVVLVWRVRDTFKAAFEVDNYEHFVKLQSEAAIRQLASSLAYDHFEDEHAEITLRSNSNEVCDMLEKQLSDRLSIAGIEIVEARISHLSYSPEIAQAMLQRQQATAIVAARQKIVEGAVGMVEMALGELSSKSIIELDDEKKAAMISNLMVVLCSERSTTPVINAGTLHH